MHIPISLFSFLDFSSEIIENQCVRWWVRGV